MSADTFTTTLGAILMGTGNDNNSWGTNLNNGAIQILEDAIANTLTTAASGGAIGPSNTLNLSSSPPPAGPSSARYSNLVFTGTISANQTVVVPNLTKTWFVTNKTTGAFTLTFNTPTGAASTPIPQNSGLQTVVCDGNNNIIVSPFNWVQIQMPDGSAAAPSYSNINEPTSGWHRAGTQDWRMSVNGTDLLQITGSGAALPSLVNILPAASLAFNGTTFSPGNIIQTGMEMAFAGLNAPSGWLLEFGQAVSRTTYSGLFNAICPTQIGGTTVTGSGTTSSSVLTGVSVSLVGLGTEGSLIEATGLAVGTKIVSVTSNTITLNQNPANNITGGTLRILPFGQGDGSTTFNVPDRRGAVLAGRSNMGGTDKGNLNSILTGSQLGASGGEQSHTLVVAEMPSHNHTVTDPGHFHTETAGGIVYPGPGALLVSEGTPGTGGQTSSATTGLTINANGGGGSHNNVQPTGVTNWIIKT